MKAITAGDCLKINVEAIDEESGVKFVEIEAENIKDKPGQETFLLSRKFDWPGSETKFTVNYDIPLFIPDSKWKVSSIKIENGVGRRIKYDSGKDFEPLLFKVLAKDGIDQSPAKLINISLED